MIFLYLQTHLPAPGIDRFCWSFRLKGSGKKQTSLRELWELEQPRQRRGSGREKKKESLTPVRCIALTPVPSPGLSRLFTGSYKARQAQI